MTAQLTLPGPCAPAVPDGLVLSSDTLARLMPMYLQLDPQGHVVSAGPTLRRVCAMADPAGRAIPAFALEGLAEDGRTRALPVLLGLMRRPRALPATTPASTARDRTNATRVRSASTATSPAASARDMVFGRTTATVSCGALGGRRRSRRP